MNNNMREDWIEVELGEVFETVTGNTPSKKEIDNYGQDIPFIKPPDITNSTIKSVSEYLSNKGKKKARVLPQNSILVTCIGNLGRIGYNKDEVAFNQQINAILPLEQIDYKFTFYQAQSGNFRNQLESLSTSTTVALVNKSSFNSIKIGVAPLPIQRAIVSKIEALFSDLDNGIANFKKAQEQLKIYRQAVLKKAFEGGFSITNEELRITESDGNDELLITESDGNDELRITNEENHSSDNLPKEWKWQRLGNVIKTIDGDRGKNYPKKNEFYENEYCLFLSTKNVRQGYFVFDENIFITKEKDEILRGGKVQLNDVVITTRGTLGNVALFNEKTKYKNIRINSGMLILRIKENDTLQPEYLMKFITSTLFFNQLKSMQTGTAQPQIPANILREIKIAYPKNLSEQTAIVSEIESRLSVTDNLEFIIRNSIEKAEALRQSILKKAFEGKLLTQAEIELCKQAADYEPASELLKKIQAEKLAKEQEKKKKPKTKK